MVIKKSLLITCFVVSLVWVGCTRKSRFLKGATNLSKDTVVVVTASHRHTIIETKQNRVYTYARDTIKTENLLKTRAITSQTNTHKYTIEITEREGIEIKRDTTSIVILDDDADGVPNFEDKCPTEKGSYKNKGCPEKTVLTAAKKQSIDQEIAQYTRDLEFGFGRPQIKPSTYAQLNAIVALLNKYPQAHLLITGHTDNVGDAQKNKQLSLDRATFVKTYFIKQGVAARRLQVVGKGDSDPIASNQTAEGRSKNRRIDIKVIN
jgi:outer membrane protein OmpA-like peptidoglycan-associated protein